MQEIIINRFGPVLSVTLNRPKALNALTIGMCSDISTILRGNNFLALIVEGAGVKAFCAGGDVKSCYNALKSDEVFKMGKSGHLASDFFREEYKMNYAIGKSLIPQVSIWNGIVMGGGVGVSIHGKYRVATDTTMFAMPETAIGLFPDVGGTYWLPRLPRGFGLYLGLTGSRIYSHDLLYTGIATHYCTNQYLEEMLSHIKSLGVVNSIKEVQFMDNKIKEILDDYTMKSGLPDSHKSILYKYESLIPKIIFGSESITDYTTISSVQTIVKRLQEYNESCEYNTEEKQFMNKMYTELTNGKLSPLSMEVTLEALKRGQMHTMDLQTCLMMEYRMMMNCMSHPDFLEGIRAVLVDKDNNPQWYYKELTQEESEMIQSYFNHLGPYELDI